MLFTVWHGICHWRFSCRLTHFVLPAFRWPRMSSSPATSSESFLVPWKTSLVSFSRRCVCRKCIVPCYSSAVRDVRSSGKRLFSLFFLIHSNDGIGIFWFLVLGKMGFEETDPCEGINGAGIAYKEFSCLYPQIEPLYFGWVKAVDQVCHL